MKKSNRKIEEELFSSAAEFSAEIFDFGGRRSRSESHPERFSAHGKKDSKIFKTEKTRENES